MSLSSRPSKPFCIGILGSTGRMGKALLSLLGQEPFQKKFQLITQIHQGTHLSDLSQCEALIDFSTPESALEIAKKFFSSAPSQSLAQSRSQSPLGTYPVFVSGTTGWNASQWEALCVLSQKGIIFQASNFSLGIAIFQTILKKIAPLLSTFHFESALIETHHKHKKDKPSGTALSLQKTLSQNHYAPTPITSIRVGETIGIHELFSTTDEENLFIRHEAKNRLLFAKGALLVTLWLLQTFNRSSPSKRTLSMEDFLHDMYQKNK